MKINGAGLPDSGGALDVPDHPVELLYPQFHNGAWRSNEQAYIDHANWQAAQQATQEAVARRSRRDDTVSSIIVTVSSGKSFDGDEQAQTRMVRALTAAQTVGLNELDWKLADNTWAKVALVELAEALLLAGLEQTRIWRSH